MIEHCARALERICVFFFIKTGYFQFDFSREMDAGFGVFLERDDIDTAAVRMERHTNEQ